MDKLPNVVIVEQIKKDSPLRKLPAWVLSFRTLYLILGAIIVVESIIGIRVLFNKVPQSNRSSQISQTQIPKISLLAEEENYQVGGTFPVKVYLTTGSYSSNGVDIVLKFNPALVSVDEKTGFTAGNIFVEYPGLRIDNTQGTLEVSGISSPTGGDFKGTGQFAEITFTAKSPGRAKFSLDFSKGSTIDTNIIDNKSGEDILSLVDNLDLTIQ